MKYIVTLDMYKARYQTTPFAAAAYDLVGTKTRRRGEGLTSQTGTVGGKDHIAKLEEAPGAYVYVTAGD